MNFNIQKINFNPFLTFREKPEFKDYQSNPMPSEKALSVYGDDVIRTKPAQLSLFHMHDFHGQNIRMEKAYSAVRQFDNNMLQHQNDVFNEDMPIDKLKLCSGDMFLGEDPKELAVVNEFFNLSGIVANAIGNHECDANVNIFADIVKNRRYRFLSTNMHPDSDNRMNEVLSNSIIAEINGNKYGIIGLTPIDMDVHLKRIEEIPPLNIPDLEGSLRYLEEDIKQLKELGVNKIILLSHMGIDNERYIAQNISDIDVILGGHTHNYFDSAIEGENLFYSPKGEPVLIVQVGRDGNYIGIPNLKFNELGQITQIQYNVLETETFPRDLLAEEVFNNILGKPEIVGEIEYTEEPKGDKYATENPHCNFMLDCLRFELGTDIAIMNSANMRTRFDEGPVDTRSLHLISPFGNKVTVIEATEKEIVDSIKSRLKLTMSNELHRPGILQVSGLKYTFSYSTGELKSLTYIDKNNVSHEIDINNPRTDKIYTVSTDDFCAISQKSGMGLKHRYDNAIQIYDFDKDAIVADYLRKQKKPVRIVADGRIKIVD